MIRHIEHLLITHDCVMIPGVGAVLAHCEPARTDAGGIMRAPVRAFTFNPALNHNDGVIAASVARAEGIAYEAALARVEGAAADMRASLEQESELSLGRVGRLTRSSDGSLSFTPSAGDAIPSASLWLPDVDLSAFSGAGANVAPVAAGVSVRRAPRRTRRIAGRLVKMAAAMALLVAVGLTLITPLQVENPQLASLGVDCIGMRRAESELLRMPGQTDAPVVLVLERRADASTPVDTAAYSAMRASAREAKAVARTAGRRYCLVVASLDSESEARKFIASHNDSTLSVLCRDGRYRVYAAQGASIAEMEAMGRAVADRYPNSWVCRR